MIRQLVWMPLCAMAVALALIAMPGEAKDEDLDIHGPVGDIDAVEELGDRDRERRRDVFNVIDDFRDDLADIVGRRQANRIVRAIRNGDDVSEVVDGLNLNRNRDRDLDRLFGDIRDSLEDIFD